MGWLEDGTCYLLGMGFARSPLQLITGYRRKINTENRGVWSMDVGLLKLLSSSKRFVDSVPGTSQSTPSWPQSCASGSILSAV